MDAPRKALVVEDDPMVRRIVVRLVSAEGFDVVEASNGHEGMHALSGGCFSLVITDLRMPGPDGIALAKVALAAEPRPHVVVSSGFATPEEEARVSALGATMLRKPFELEPAKRALRLPRGPDVG